MAHDGDAGRLGGQRLLELLDHLLRRPARELLVQLSTPSASAAAVAPVWRASVAPSPGLPPICM